MSALQIAGHDLVPGKKIKDAILVNGTSISVPYFIITGNSAGPTLLITAGIHNAEFVGIQAAIELSHELDPEDIHGTVVIVPLANPSGFEHRTMSLVYEDGRNLNRVFPGDRHGTEAYRLAYMLFNTFIKNADAYIDLHSGDGYEELTPYVYYVGGTDVAEKSAAMAACVDTEYCVKSRCLTGGAYNLASVNGVPSVLIERGQLSQLPRELVEQDKADVLNIMKQLGIIDGEAAAYEKQVLREKEMHSPASGCWYPAKHAGDSFKRGEMLGTLKDYFGETLHEIIAPEDGIILYQTASLNIIEGGPMISYGVHDHSHHHEKLSSEHASRMSQLGDEVCAVHDTAEMNELREKHDSDSLLKLGGLLIGQYRYKEAATVLEEALLFEPDSAKLHLRLGGIALTLFRYEEALSHYDDAERAGIPAQALSFPRGIAYYFKGKYEKASEFFMDHGPCDGEALISAIYWDTLSSCRAGSEMKTLKEFDPEIDVGHHTAYKDVVLVFAGAKEPDDIVFRNNELDDAIVQYGLSVYYEAAGDKEKAAELCKLATDHERVWPCIASLAAWNDMKNS